MDRENKVDKFIEHPKKALFILAWPIAVGFLVQSLYNIIDTAFVGRIGAEAIAALTFAFPIFIFLIGINSGIGAGVNSRISRYLGAKEKEKAENAAIHGIIISIVLAVAFILILHPLLKPLFSLFGAESSVIALSYDYMSIVLLGTLFMFPAFTINSIFSAQGDTKVSMMIQLASLITNMILDPLLIYVLGWGVKGAAIATTASFAVGLVLAVYLLKKRSYLHLRRESFSYSKRIVKQIFKVGAPASLTMVLMSVSTIFLNRIISTFGTDNIAAYGISFRMESIATFPIIALSLALLTLVGMFKGAGKYEHIKEIVSYALKVGFVFTFLMGAVIFAVPHFLLRIFTNEQLLLGLGSSYLRIDVFSLPMVVVGMIVSRVMQALGEGLPTFVISTLRLIVVAVPVAYLFVNYFNFGFVSIAFAMVLGALVSAIVAYIWLRIRFKRLVVLE